MSGDSVADSKMPRLSENTFDKPLTVICHPDNIEVINDLADVMTITPEDTLAMTAKFTDRSWELAKQDEDFKMRLRMIFPELDIVADPRHIRDYPVAYRHIVGLIICMNKAINTGKRPFVQLPETYLHPRSQANLGTLFAAYTKLGQEDDPCRIAAGPA